MTDITDAEAAEVLWASTEQGRAARLAACRKADELGLSRTAGRPAMVVEPADISAIVYAAYLAAGWDAEPMEEDEPPAHDHQWKHTHNIARANPFRGRIADLLRKYADRLDHAGAPKAMYVRFTFEDHVGIVFRDDGRGCRLWYFGDQDYERAHTEAGPVLGANSTAWLPQRKTPAWPGADIPVASFTVRLDSPSARITLGGDPDG